MSIHHEEPARAAALTRLQEERDLAAAHLLVADEPDAWFTAGDSEQALVAALAAHGEPADLVAAREAFATLPRTTQAKLLDPVLAGYLQSTTPPSGEPTPSIHAHRRVRAGWLAGLSVAAAAAAALVIFNAAPPTGETLVGEVHFSAAVRGDPARIARQQLASGDWFYLDCRSPGRSITVAGVRAVPMAPLDGDGTPRLLGGERTSTAADGATLHLRADLPPGTWEVSCEVHEAASGRLLTLAPPAVLVVQ